jgi:hypothetical protein
MHAPGVGLSSSDVRVRGGALDPDPSGRSREYETPSNSIDETEFQAVGSPNLPEARKPVEVVVRLNAGVPSLNERGADIDM